MVAEAASLGGAARRVVFGVEIEHHALATELAQAEFVALFVKAQQVGGLVSYVHS